MLSRLIILALGLGVGFAGGYIYCKKVFDDKYVVVTEELDEHGLPVSPKKDTPEAPVVGDKVVVDSSKKLDKPVDITEVNYKDRYQVKQKDIKKDEKKQMSVGDSQVAKIINENMRGPYLITEDQFNNENGHYEKFKGLTFYAGNGTLTDENDEPNPNLITMVGRIKESMFGDENSSDPDIIYIRNDSRYEDYEIVLDKGSYKDPFFEGDN